MKQKKQSITSGNKSLDGVIALLTDFGDRDHYVGTVKGVILSINPRARIVDLCHNVHPQDVGEAGYLLWASYRYFPRGTVFTCILDPEVGSERKIICIETGSHRFVAPDNGLLDPIVADEQIVGSFEIIDPKRFGLEPISATFHGRDIFAPLAALLSLGKSAGQFGKHFVPGKPMPLFYAPEKGFVQARILHVDLFGNLVTNISQRYFNHCVIQIGITEISEHIHIYAEAPPKQPCMIVGSSGLIEVIVKNGNASEYLRANTKTQVQVLNVER